MGGGGGGGGGGAQIFVAVWHSSGVAEMMLDSVAGIRYEIVIRRDAWDKVISILLLGMINQD